MKTYTRTIKELNQIILNEDLSENSCCILLELKKEILYGKIDPSKGINVVNPIIWTQYVDE